MNYPLLLAKLLAILTTAQAPERLMNEAVMRRVSDATVFIRIDLGGGQLQTGSGFLVRRQGKAGYIITNDHVVKAAADGDRRIDTVFFSGLRHEKVYPATIMARDPSMDLAILKIEAPTLPAPLNATRPPAINETSPVFIFGFPFGEELTTSKGSPAVTIAPALVSSLRRDESGEVRIVQLQGDLNPGNSGGPIVDQNGGLVGVAVAKITGTLIGFAIAPGGINEMFLGGPRTISLKATESGADWVSLRAEVGLNNPMETIASVSILLLPKEKMPELPPSGKLVGRAPAFKQMTEHPLQIKDSVGSADLKLDKDRAKDGIYWLQVKCVRKNRQTTYSDPKIVDVKAAHAINVVEGEKEEAKPSPKRQSDSDSESGTAAATTKPSDAGADSRKGWLGAPAGEKLSMIGEVKKVLGATVSEVNLDTESSPGTQAIWSRDGKQLYLVSCGSRTQMLWTLRIIAVPEFKELGRVSLEKRSYVQLGLSKAGIVLFAPGELNLYSPTTFKLIRRIEVPECDRMAACPVLDVAFCHGRTSNELVAIDLDKANSTITRASDIKSTAKKNEFGMTFERFDGRIDITPDGKYFLHTGSTLDRFRINGKSLVHEETAPFAASHDNLSPAEFTPDGRQMIETLQPMRDSKLVPGKYFVAVNDFSKTPKPSTAPSGASLKIDPVSGNMYIGQGSLTVYNAGGVPQRVYRTAAGSGFSRTLVHPSGNKVLMLGEGKAAWVELPADGPVLSEDVPTPQTGGEQLKVTPVEKQGLTYKTTSLPNQIRGEIIMSRDGEGFYVLGAKGFLQKFKASTFQEQCRLRIEGKPQGLCLCAEGLVVCVGERQELWLINEADLRVMKRIPWCPENRVITSPGLSGVIGAGTGNFAGLVIVQDLRGTGSAVAFSTDQIRPPSSDPRGPEFASAQVSPDGKYLIATAEGQVFRYGIKGSQLECEEVGRSERLRHFDARKVFSSDSMYFAIGNNIYRTTDLRAPVLQTSDQNNRLGFDPKSGKVYEANYRSNKLAILGVDGKPEKEFDAPFLGTVLVHPQGHKLLILNDSESLLTVDLSTAGG